MKYFKQILLAAALMWSASVLATNSIDSIGNQCTLPITTIAGKNFQLQVDIPCWFAHFRNENGINEYRKINEFETDWSEIIVTETCEMQMSAAQAITLICDGYRGQVQCESIQNLGGNKGVYSWYTMIIAYTTPNGFRKVTGLKFFSIKKQCVGVQYAIALSDSITQEKAVDMIRDFVENNVQITSYKN